MRNVISFDISFFIHFSLFNKSIIYQYYYKQIKANEKQTFEILIIFSFSDIYELKKENYLLLLVAAGLPLFLLTKSVKKGFGNSIFPNLNQFFGVWRYTKQKMRSMFFFKSIFSFFNV